MLPQCLHIKENADGPHGSGQKGAAVLLPGFAINSLVQNQIW